MPRFRKRPLEVDAFVWTPEMGEVGGVVVHPGIYDRGFIHTADTDLPVFPGDWIVAEPSGERYPVKPEIFQATYDPIPPAEGWQG